jgi:hypothetical protein
LKSLFTYIQMYQNDMKMVLDRYTAIQEGSGVKPRHMYKLYDTCKAQRRDTYRTSEDLKDSLDI